MIENISLFQEFSGDAFKLFWENMPIPLMNKIEYLITLLKISGIIFIIYIIFSIIKDLWILKVLKRLKRIEQKMNETHIKINRIEEILSLISEKKFLKSDQKDSEKNNKK